MAWQGKDGAWYNSRSEYEAANRRWEQNQLLKEQNQLLKDAERQRQRDRQNQELKEQQELRRQQWEREKERIREESEQRIREAQERREAIQRETQGCLKSLERNIINTLPLFSDAGINNPDAYIGKLTEIYPCDLIKGKNDDFFTQLRLNNISSYHESVFFDAEHHEASPARKLITDDLNSDSPILDSDTANVLLERLSEIIPMMSKLWLTANEKAMGDLGNLFWPSIIGLLSFAAYIWFVNDIFEDRLLFSLLGPIIVIVSYVLVKRRIKEDREKEYQEKMTRKVPRLNSLIDSYNGILQTEESAYLEKKVQLKEQKEKRIIAYENRRVQNFNSKLEYALEILTGYYQDAYDELLAIGKDYNIDLASGECPNFTLHHFPYPSEYELFKYSLKRNQAIENGTDIFLDL